MKVLLAIDDSKFSEAALQTLIAQSRPGGVEIRALHVVERPSFSVPPEAAMGYVPDLEDQRKEARKLVERAAATLRTAGFKADPEVREGDIRELILDSAAQWGAGLIVLGSHGRRGLQRFLLGSVAESVARHAHCSVEIVRGPVRQ
jgi:nucleotide-binding universal stress UspA family protein